MNDIKRLVTMYTNSSTLNNFQHNIIVNQQNQDTKEMIKKKNQLNLNIMLKISDKLNPVLYKHFVLWNYKTLKISTNEYLIRLGNILYRKGTNLMEVI